MVPDYSFSHFCSTPLWNFLTIQLYHRLLLVLHSSFFHFLACRTRQFCRILLKG
uniref:Uncharacterized protein n=1 Tax=Siphoviridae sp. ctVFv13 TaxID=2827576 RepID=A0A8S5LQF7_9CAUD|nr:MAG TPA: hypothetical protein [Siphoviridae sp. ctVFv13]